MSNDVGYTSDDLTDDVPNGLKPANPAMPLSAAASSASSASSATRNGVPDVFTNRKRITDDDDDSVSASASKRRKESGAAADMDVDESVAQRPSSPASSSVAGAVAPREEDGYDNADALIAAGDETEFSAILKSCEESPIWFLTQRRPDKDLLLSSRSSKPSVPGGTSRSYAKASTTRGEPYAIRTPPTLAYFPSMTMYGDARMVNPKAKYACENKDFSRVHLRCGITEEAVSQETRLPTGQDRCTKAFMDMLVQVENIHLHRCATDPKYSPKIYSLAHAAISERWARASKPLDEGEEFVAEMTEEIRRSYYTKLFGSTTDENNQHMRVVYVEADRFQKEYGFEQKKNAAGIQDEDPLTQALSSDEMYAEVFRSGHKLTPLHWYSSDGEILDHKEQVVQAFDLVSFDLMLVPMVDSEKNTTKLKLLWSNVYLHKKYYHMQRGQQATTDYMSRVHTKCVGASVKLRPEDVERMSVDSNKIQRAAKEFRQNQEKLAADREEARLARIARA